MTPILRLVLTLSFIFFSISSKGQDCCDQDDITTLCFLSSSDYCQDPNDNCTRYSLDGLYMKDALKLKLENPAFFGENGMANCNIQLEKLSKNFTQFELDDLKCDIIFLPSLPLNPTNENLEHDKTFFPKAILDEVYSWSTRCDDHLVIASQGETTYWGYEVKGVIQNPSRAVATSQNEFFDGPFGLLDNFELDGGFNGVFTDQANGQILAVDNSGKASILLDPATNDLMLSDIGIFCSDGAGKLSVGDQIENDNDKLALNIFAYACNLADSPFLKNESIELCESFIELSDGSMVSDTGAFSIVLPNETGCDTTVRIEVIPCEEVSFPNIFSPNRDGRNDFFNIITESEITIEKFKVFNRWGQLVYNNERPERGWDGTHKGKAAPPGVYIYHIIYSNSIGTRTTPKVGDVTLMR